MIELTEAKRKALHREALKLLKEKGVEAEGYLLDAVKGIAGITQTGNRLCFEPQLVDRVIQENYHVLSLSGQGNKESEVIQIGVCDLPQYYMRVDSSNSCNSKIEMMTVKNLIEATKFLEAMQQTTRGVWSMVPGVPRDVPSQLQAITEFYIGCEFCSNGGNVDTLYPQEALTYVSRMAEAMGGVVDSIGMFTISPMRLGGFEMEMAIRNLDRFQSFSISSLPTLGATAPIFLTPAWIVSIAEVLAGAVVLYLLSGGKPVSISAGMFPFEPRKLWVAGGMPEHAVMEYQRSHIAKSYNPNLTYSHSMTTSAKRPCSQAGMEKAMGAMFAAAHGCRSFNTAGLLSFDDIFSPTQFILDVEIRNLLSPYLNGQTADKMEEGDWRGLIDEGLESGYVATETTLENYKEAIYFSPLLNREVFQKELVGTPVVFGSEMVELAQKRAAEVLESYCYQAPPDKLKLAREIFDEAWEMLADGAKNPFQ